MNSESDLSFEKALELVNEISQKYRKGRDIPKDWELVLEATYNKHKGSNERNTYAKVAEGSEYTVKQLNSNAAVSLWNLLNKEIDYDGQGVKQRTCIPHLKEYQRRKQAAGSGITDQDPEIVLGVELNSFDKASSIKIFIDYIFSIPGVATILFSNLLFLKYYFSGIEGDLKKEIGDSITINYEAARGKIKLIVKGHLEDIARLRSRLESENQIQLNEFRITAYKFAGETSVVQPSRRRNSLRRIRSKNVRRSLSVIKSSLSFIAIASVVFIAIAAVLFTLGFIIYRLWNFVSTQPGLVKSWKSIGDRLWQTEEQKGGMLLGALMFVVTIAYYFSRDREELPDREESRVRQRSRK
ncbi:hypothetical protein DSM107010_54070 [Chroococcidiopsis cubana SAG 39.79]|uniref:Uncharacterized protein n=1 Tax=Chroococcidiopsis cubana SAG 39.79 TaxID=388085 RepID=A0AB37UCL0_9CYAN|nr:hypothetical protein [Chroococcidiopsis cubana]PSB62431.1 hypothetical protein C7B79_18075 [Chroococcidiopsis cubana CCALA 043]RUT05877.1 hypothetical protein DSM107010_54070 [Chroococcidiopsis cubana SAG 39.79]